MLLALVIGLAALALFGAQGGASASPQTMMLIPIPGSPYSSPVFVAGPAGDQHRIFVVQQGGVIRVVDDGALQSTPFLTVPNIQCCGEQGLLSMAFAPDYATSRKFYVYYTSSQGHYNHVDEFQRDGMNPDIADPNSRREVLVIPHPFQSNHNGGQLEFGPDGYLYVGTGDGGGGGDPYRTGQNLQELRGKILRIDPLRGEPYSIPPNNPFVDQPPALPEIFAYGVRNPWRYSFDRQTGDFTLGDVGQDLGGDRLPAAEPRRGERRRLRLELQGGQARLQPAATSLSAAAGPADRPRLRVPAQRRAQRLLDHRRLRRSRHRPRRHGRPLHLRRLLQRAHLLTAPPASQLGRRPAESELFAVPGLSSFGEDGCGHVYVADLDGPVYKIQQQDPPPPSCLPVFPNTLTGDVNQDFSIHLRDPNGVDLNGARCRLGPTRSRSTTTARSTTSTCSATPCSVWHRRPVRRTSQGPVTRSGR